jgi:hypothetical protein
MACYKMKKTPIIRSVYMLLGALLFENVYFLITAIANATSEKAWEILTHPILWSVPKILLGIGLTYFVVASLSPSKDPCRQINRIPRACPDKEVFKNVNKR